MAETAAHFGLWWEARQQRLLNEAQHEEDKRIPWLADMLARWGAAHRNGDGLDLRVTEYLAREAAETMAAIAANKRVAVPQSMLLELDLVLRTLAAARVTFRRQFEALLEHPEIDDIRVALRSVLPQRSLNIAFVRSLAEDPAVEWEGLLRTKATNDFDRELAESYRHPSVFVSRLFPSTEVVAWEAQSSDVAPKFFDQLVGFVTAALPKPLDSARPIAAERLDTFRELVLVRAEASRVKSLHTAWLATADAIGESMGAPLRVEWSANGVKLEIGSSMGAVPSEDASPGEGAHE
ncbi:hypothetical protein D8Y24_03160 [Agrococcus lahaulensis]|nr:hypothetical protein D8Y24_03160 [Agrococcus lahaulensis]